MESGFHLSKSDVQTKSNRRSTRIRNAITVDESVNKNRKGKVNTEGIRKVPSEQSEINHTFGDSNDDASLDAKSECETTIDPMLFSSKHEGNEFKKNNCTVNSPYTHSENSNILQPEIVSKVFKILSKPNSVTSSGSQQSNSKSGKSVLKTYCKQLNSPPNSQVSESFGLPDIPIISQDSSLTANIDIESVDAKEITLLDVKFSDEPWELTDIGGNHLLSNMEEIRFKEHPQKLLNFGDVLDKDQDIETEYVITSTPRSKSNQGPKKRKCVNSDLLKSNLRELSNEKVCGHKEFSKKGKNNLVHYNSLNHENEEVEIFNTSRIRRSSALPIKNQNARKFDFIDHFNSNEEKLGTGFSEKEENTDKEVDIILSKKNCHQHSLQNKKLLRSLDIGIKFKPNDNIDVPRRILRSKSSLAISSENIWNTPLGKQSSRHQRNKWLSVSQDNLISITKTDRIKAKLLNKSFPQLKVILSPINTFSADILPSELRNTKMNSTRKSLRSYKDLDKLDISNDSNSDISLKQSKHTGDSIYSLGVLKYAEKAKKSAPRPQIFDDNSSSLDSINNITKDNDTSDKLEELQTVNVISTPSKMFQQIINHSELTKVRSPKNHKKLSQKKSVNCSAKAGDKLTLDEKSLNTSNNDNTIAPKVDDLEQNEQASLNSEMDNHVIEHDATRRSQIRKNSLQHSTISEPSSAAEHSANENIVGESSCITDSELYLPNNDPQLEIYKTNSSENLEETCGKKTREFVDDTHLNVHDQLYKIELQVENVQKGVPKIISSPQKRGRGRPRRQKQTIENSISAINTENSNVEDDNSFPLIINNIAKDTDTSDKLEEPQADVGVISSPSHMFQRMIKHSELTKVRSRKNHKKLCQKKSVNCTAREGDKITLNDDNETATKVDILEQNDQFILNSEINNHLFENDATTRSQIRKTILGNSKISQLSLATEQSVNKNIIGDSSCLTVSGLCVPKETQSEIYKTNSSKNLVETCREKPSEVVNDAHLKVHDQLYKIELPVENVQNSIPEIIPTPQKKGRGRTRKQKQAFENSISAINTGNSNVEDEKELNSRKINSVFHTEKLLKNCSSVDTNSITNSSCEQIEAEQGQSTDHPNYEPMEESDEIEMDPMSQPGIIEEAENINGQSWLDENQGVNKNPSNSDNKKYTEHPPIIKKSGRRKQRKCDRKLGSQTSENLENQSFIESIKNADGKNDANTNTKEMPSTQFIISNESITFSNLETKSNNRLPQKRSRHRNIENDTTQSTRKRGRPKKIHYYTSQSTRKCGRTKKIKYGASQPTRNRGRPRKTVINNCADDKLLSSKENDPITTKGSAKNNILHNGNSSVGQTLEFADGGQEIIALDSVFGVQNTIADLVKKRSRSPKNYKLSRSWSSGSKIEKFEDSRDISTNISDPSNEIYQSTNSSNISKPQTNDGTLGSKGISEAVDVTDCAEQNEEKHSTLLYVCKEKEIKDVQEHGVEQNEIQVESIKSNIDSTECGEKILEFSEKIIDHVNGWKKKSDDKINEIQYENGQDGNKSVSNETGAGEMNKKKHKDNRDIEEQKQDRDLLEIFNNKNDNFENHGNKATIKLTLDGKNKFAQENGDPGFKEYIDSNLEKENSVTNKNHLGNAKEKSEDESIMVSKVENHNSLNNDCTRKEDTVQGEIHKQIEETSKINGTLFHIDDKCPERLKERDDNNEDNLVAENYLENECPNLLKRADIPDEDIKDIKNANLIDMPEKEKTEQKGHVAEKYDYDIEDEMMAGSALFVKSSHKHILRSKTSLGDRLPIDGCKNANNLIKMQKKERTKQKGNISEKYDYDTEDEITAESTLFVKGPRSHKHILRSKTSLGDRFKIHDSKDDTPALITKPRRSSFEYFQTNIDNMEKLKECSSGDTTLTFTKQVRPPHLEMIKDIRGNALKFKVGSIAWAQIGSHPFWPCLVTVEPSTGIYVKNTLTRSLPRMCYHVKFFGDKGRRAWISRHKMMVYKNKGDLEEICNSLRKENKSWKELQFYSVKAKYLKKWLPAVEEAEYVKSKPLKERISFFDLNSIANEVEAIKYEGSALRKRSRSFKMEDSDNSGASINQDSPVKKKDCKLECSTGVEDVPVKIEEVDLTAEIVEIPTNAAKKKNRVSKVQTPKDTFPSTSDTSTTEKKSLKSSPAAHGLSKKIAVIPKEEIVEENPVTTDNQELETNNESSETSEGEKAESHNLSTFFCESIDAQYALFKRNNIFKGVSREKVCQYCFVSGDVLKCKGCNAVYHAECAIKVLQELVIPKRRNRISFVKEDGLFEESRIKVEADDKESDSREIKMMESDDEDHVQIITVPSSVYNTPPRKSFPPNFQNLTLAEQIDFKMKEVMRKFESKTTYADSHTDTSSEESSCAQLSRSRSFSRSHISFPPIVKRKQSKSDNFQVFSKPLELCNGVKTMKSVRHVTADLSVEHIVFSESEDLLDKPSSSAIHVTADSSATKVSEGNVAKRGKSKKFGAKHVTADCVSLETPDSENSNSNFSHHTKHSDNSETTDSVKSVNPKQFKCGFCIEQTDPYCFVCHRAVSKKGSAIRHKCSLYQCSRFYHRDCLKLWPQTQWSLIQTTKHRYSQEEIDSFVCPQHVCHTCVSDDPRAATSRCSGDKIVKCQRCPSTYHSTSLCVPAGTEILSSTQIVCPRHRDKSKMYTINTTWCFLCSEGGALICCETCPTSVHPECMPQVNLREDENFVCEDCESGRLPLYDEIVWVKLGKYRWWPGLVLFPNEIPAKVASIKHNVGEFVVKFFGTYDHYWVNRGRSFLFQEGDTGDTKVSNKKKVEQAAYKKAVDEAVVVHKLKKEFKVKLEGEYLNSQKPPPYIKIKVNKPVGNVKLMELDLSNTTACECNPRKPNPCGPESDCLNRLLLTECYPEACPAGKSCQNQSFEKREYPPMIPYKTQGRGWGLKCLAAIKRGQFVIEYVGELIDDEEYQRRIQKMHEQKEENYYFLTIDKDRMIDAGPKGNMARFMNHCCQPNCETQKWTVNGDTKVGLFATKDIPADTELTFNYNLECTGKEKKICRCGAPNCSGFIGVKAKQETEVKKPKKTYKKKEPVKPLVLPPCFICKRRGDVAACNNKMCNKAYHLTCLNLAEWPEGNKFACPWHNCNTCSKRTIRCCVKCLNSFCPSHSEGNVRYDNLLGFVCSNHDPSNFGSEKMAKKKQRVIADEMDVSSTTPDDPDDVPLSHRRQWENNNNKNSSSDSDAFDIDKFNAVPVKHRYRRKRTKKNNASDSDDEDFDPANSSTSIRFGREEEENDNSQDETVSSATASDFEEEALRKRKRRKSKRKSQARKKNKLNTVVGPPITANENDINNVNSENNRHAIDSNRL